MNKSMSLAFRLIGVGFCVGAGYVATKGDIDLSEYLFILGVYFIGKGDYYELKGG